MRILSMKVILISFGVVSFAMGIKFCTPLFNQVPVIWSIILPWTRPPYLYLIVNGIIITIAASSRFHKVTSSPSISYERLDSVKTPPPSDFASFPVQPEISAADERSLLEDESENSVVEVKAMLINGAKVDIDPTGEEIDADAEIGGEDKVVISTSTYIPPHTIISPVQTEFLPPPVREKPLDPPPFRHRKIIRNSKGARIPRVTRSKRHETLERTWNMITEGHQIPPTKHLKKSDTWQRHEHHEITSPPDDVPKSNTFKTHTSYKSPIESPLRLASSTEISRELSPSQDELNRKVEAFIEKFNEEMRLQRQESLDQYMEMINRGV
ncbi:Hypothetical predicted protein [Olea europaea subsp. europaea]|uniref:DUF4408 domain-containing protein n=1 Tax=Olea europaea subsp. europaea TaxID=158383 RepID=A0A8S0QST5_OLEEU|nr:Hypothetical predicted protein [Olea europaea subsp. europaea]